LNASLVQNKLGGQGQIFGEVERMPPKRSNMDETFTLKHLLEMVENFELEKAHELG
jgi:hypothetical protein